MIQNKLICLIVAVVVVLCPLRCMIGGCQQSNVSETPAVACQCCHHPTPDLPQPAPEPWDDCECSDCFCRGALPIHGDSPVITRQFISDIVVWAQPQTIQPLLIERQFVRHFSLIPVEASAVAVRAVLSCWLI